MKIEFEEKRAFWGLVEALRSEIFIWKVTFGASVDIGRSFFGKLQALGPMNTLFGKGEEFYDMRNK